MISAFGREPCVLENGRGLAGQHCYHCHFLEKARDISDTSLAEVSRETIILPDTGQQILQLSKTSVLENQPGILPLGYRCKQEQATRAQEAPTGRPAAAFQG